MNWAKFIDEKALTAEEHASIAELKATLKPDLPLGVRKGIKYNPLLKTKLIGVLATNFMRSGMVIEKEPERDKDGNVKMKDGVPVMIARKDAEGDSIPIYAQCSKYVKQFIDYKNRIKRMPAHKDKSKGHRHQMALRYMVKRFLVDLYVAWRTLEGLPLATEYSVGKLGMVHNHGAEDARVGGGVARDNRANRFSLPFERHGWLHRNVLSVGGSAPSGTNHGPRNESGRGIPRPPPRAA
jgi:hypothetical protein